VTRLDESHSGQTLRAAVGETLELSLGEKPTTGHRWEVVSSGDPVCSLRETSFAPTSMRPGGGGVRRFAFDLEGAGEGEIVLVYRRAWEKGKGAREFRLRVLGEQPA